MQDRQRKQTSDQRQDQQKIICYSCNEPGHKAPNCPNKDKPAVDKGKKAMALIPAGPSAKPA